MSPFLPARAPQLADFKAARRRADPKLPAENGGTNDCFNVPSQFCDLAEFATDGFALYSPPGGSPWHHCGNTGASAEH
ncbi:MAG TPA: hypothetical protein DEG43_00595 [Acidimicrobiaceae bacterium]|nr:hypothetical protein [Acidimicrobiaceae bacterium]